MSNVDVLILIPLIPALPVIVTWWLPWEFWLPKRIPKSLLGIYLLYGAFVAWHFKMPWWCVLVAAGYGAVALIAGLQEKTENDPFTSTNTENHSLLRRSRSNDPPKQTR
jgi:uncharacterized membrane protein